jgi:hypothetical protein
MKKQELEKTIEKLHETIKILNQQINSLNEKVDNSIEKANQKYEPIDIEKSIMYSIKNDIQSSIRKICQERLSNWDSPIVKIITELLRENHNNIKKIIGDCLYDFLENPNAKVLISQEIQHKVARSIVNIGMSAVDKEFDYIKNDTELKVKIATIITNFAKENIVIVKE